MVTCALAGATTGLGLTVLHTFLSTPNKHNFVLLSRSPSPSLTAKGVSVRVVDYNSPSTLVSALDGVHTVFSFIGGSGNIMESAQLALLDASKQAGVKRFAPSEYAAPSNDGVDAYVGKERVWNAVKESGLQYTKFSCGLFLNVLGTGTPKDATEGSWAKTGEEEALGGLRPWEFVIDKRRGTADVPGDGEAKIVLTTTEDVGRFVLRALDLESWPEHLGMQGDLKSFNELIGLLEKAQQRKFLVKHNTVAEIEEQIRANPATTFYNQVRIAIAERGFDFPDTLNRLFPNVRPTTAEQYVDRWWSGVTDLGEPAWGEDKLFDIA